MEIFPRYWPFVRGIRRSPVNSPQKSQWRGVLMFSLTCALTNGWVNNRAHYDVTIMSFWSAPMATPQRTYFTGLKRPKYISGLMIDFHRPGTEQIALNSLIILNNLIMITFISLENIFIISLPSGIDIAPLQIYILRFAVPRRYCNTNCADLNWYNINTFW